MMPLMRVGWLAAACASLLIGAAYLVKVHHVTAAESLVAGDPSQGLVVTYGASGLERLSWGGQVLEDVKRTPADAFHIWHMAATDLSGRPLAGPEYGWGENNKGRTWDSSTKTWLYEFGWGTIRARYEQTGDRLNIVVTEENRPDSGIAFQGASIYPLVLSLPDSQRLAAEQGATDRRGEDDGAAISDNTNEPGVTSRTFGKGTVAIVTPGAADALYSGCEPRPAVDKSVGALCAVVVSSTRPDVLKDATSVRRAVMPGQSDTYTLSLRFLPTGVALTRSTAEVYQDWARRWPATLSWKDRRVVGTVYLASSPQTGTSTSVTNPRRYFTMGETAFDVNSGDGLEKFQTKVLATAEQTITNLKKLDAQGVITWDVEGEQYPQSTSYVCSPDQIAAVSPEMESRVKVRGSRFFGMKLDDAYFKTLRDAGFRVGVCVRPQHFLLDRNGNAHQQNLPANQIATELIRKMRFAHDRWGATIFYLDSTVDANGKTLDPAILEEAAKAVPDSLLIPEESVERMYRATAPFRTFLFHGDLGTSRPTHALYPDAFSMNLINDVDPAKLAAGRSALVESVRRGDVLMVHADYWHVNNDTVTAIYREAANR